MSGCAACGRAIEARYRFCPWCGAAQRRKIVEFFRAHPSGTGHSRSKSGFGFAEAMTTSIGSSSAGEPR